MSNQQDGGAGFSRPPEDTICDLGEQGCGELLIELRQRMATLETGQVLRLIAYDPGAREDIPAWCRMTGHHLIEGAADLASGAKAVYRIRKS